MVAELSGAIAAPPGIMDDVATAERILIGRDAELEELSSLLGVRVVPEACDLALFDGQEPELAGLADRVIHR